jgi:hypothetical protein
MTLEKNGPFSKKYGHSPREREIKIREDAPEGLRATLLQSLEKAGLVQGEIRDEIVCPTLKKLPNPNNWSASNIWDEVLQLVKGCEWFKVYDLIERGYIYIAEKYHHEAAKFEQSINEYFREEGIGWQLVDGEIQIRGTEAFESSVHGAIQTLAASGRTTASGELHEALRDLSRRPTPDITGAIQHAMAALECVARDCTGNPKATLGDIIKRNPNLLPKPLDEAVEKVWGYASEMGRHLREGRVPDLEQAELIVGLAASLANYFDNKGKVK